MSKRTIYYHLNATFESWIKNHFFCMVNFWPLYCFENVCIVLEQVWLGFDQGFDRRWTWSRSFKVINQTTHGFWTNEIRHSVIFCCIRLVKTRKGIITLIIVTITRLVYHLSNSLQRKKGVNNFFAKSLLNATGDAIVDKENLGLSLSIN